MTEGLPPGKGASGSIGVLLVNLGTPDAPTPAALKRYLAGFLVDPRVIELPLPLRWLLLHGFILRTRPRRSAEAYAKVWMPEGSPLLVISRKQASALQEALDRRSVGPIKVVLAMRYGNPSIRMGLEQLREAGAKRILVFPLYPQYSAPAAASVFDAVANVFKDWRWLPELRMVMDYHDDEAYIQALAQSLRTVWTGREPPERLLFSFHGMPRECVDAGDPYYHQCLRTARLVAENLGLPETDLLVAFQSRFGPKEWLKPYADETLREWGQGGVKRVDVVCPGFAADCLETLEEIDIRLRETFLAAGGQDFHYIPALNDNPDHVEVLANLVLKHTAGWLEPD
jgi:ferrochelatase